MIDWCTVNGDLKKTLRVPGPVTGPLGSWGTLRASGLAWPGRAVLGRRNMNMNLQDASCEPPETVGGCQAVCITLPRDTRDTGGHTPLTRVSYICIAEKISWGCSRHWQLVSPGSSAALSIILADKLARWLMTDDHNSELTICVANPQLCNVSRNPK